MKSKPARLAIALQVCPLDVWIAHRLARLICSFEINHSDIEFIISARRDTNPAAIEELQKIVSDTFENVQVIRGKRYGTGWPLGPNDLWQETMMRVSQLADAGKITASGVLTFESDCIPLRPDWLDVLASEWEQAEREGFWCVGHVHGEPPTHINGNAIFSVHVTDRHAPLNGCDSRQGWDAYHGDLLLNIGKDTNAIYQRYRIKNISRKEVEEIRKNEQIPALFHGIKRFDGLQAVEDMIADKTFFNRI